MCNTTKVNVTGYSIDAPTWLIFESIDDRLRPKVCIHKKELLFVWKMHAKILRKWELTNLCDVILFIGFIPLTAVPCCILALPRGASGGATQAVIFIFYRPLPTMIFCKGKKNIFFLPAKSWPYLIIFTSIGDYLRLIIIIFYCGGDDGYLIISTVNKYITYMCNMKWIFKQARHVVS